MVTKQVEQIIDYSFTETYESNKTNGHYWNDGEW